MQKVLLNKATGVSLDINPATFTVPGAARFSVSDYLPHFAAYEIGPGYRRHCLGIDEGATGVRSVRIATLLECSSWRDVASILPGWSSTRMSLCTVWNVLTSEMVRILCRAPDVNFNVSSGVFDGTVFGSFMGNGLYIDAISAESTEEDRSSSILGPGTMFVVPV